MMRLNQRQIEAFLAVADAGNFSHAVGQRMTGRADFKDLKNCV
jgi:hypothetical protein